MYGKVRTNDLKVTPFENSKLFTKRGRHPLKMENYPKSKSVELHHLMYVKVYNLVVT